MPMPSIQQCHAMSTYFINACDAAGIRTTVNRNKAKSGWQGMLIDYSVDEARRLVDYYVEKYQDPRIDWFLYNYEKVAEAREEEQKVRAAREEQRRETKERLEQWRNRWKK